MPCLFQQIVEELGKKGKQNSTSSWSQNYQSGLEGLKNSTWGLRNVRYGIQFYHPRVLNLRNALLKTIDAHMINNMAQAGNNCKY